MTHPLGCRCLPCALTRLRLLLHSEAPMQLNTHAAPVLRDFEGIPERETDEGGTGLPFTASFHRYLSGPDSWGVTRLGMLSIIEVSDACASKHPPHRRPMFTRTLCGDILFKAAYLGQSIDDIVWITGMSVEQVTGLLSWGLGHAEQWRTERFARWTKVPGEAAPIPERRRSVA